MTLILNPLIKFDRKLHYETKTTLFHVDLIHKDFFFQSKGTYWWNNLPCFMFTQTDGYHIAGFSREAICNIKIHDIFHCA